MSFKKEGQLQGQIDWKIKCFYNYAKSKLESDGNFKNPNIRTENKEFFFPEVQKTYNFYLAVVSRPDHSLATDRNIGVFLINNNEETLDLKVAFSFVVKKTLHHTMERTRQFPPHTTVGSFQYISLKNLEQFVSITKNCLHIRCKFTILKSNVISSKSETCQHSMAKMLTSKKFSDFKIICDDQTFDCHKHMLANKSDVFDEMFSENWLESKSGSIKMEHFDSQTVKQMLHYIYTNQIQISKDDDLIELILIADKYNIRGLFNARQLEMSKQMNVKNVADFTEVASRVGATRLRKVAIDFATGKGRSATGTARWREMVEANPEVSEEISSREASKKKQYSGSKLYSLLFSLI